MNEAPELRRVLLGYSKEDVESILEARERMFERVSAEANERKEEMDQLQRDLDNARAETRAARDETQRVRSELNAQVIDIRQEVETLRADLERTEERRREAEARASRLEADVRRARAEADDLNDRLRSAETAATPEPRELGAVLEATQDAIARILADARRSAEDDLARVQRTRNEMQVEVDRVRTWRERIEPVTHDLASGIFVAQSQMSQTAERVGDALRPMSDALAALSQHLDELGRVADPAGVTPARPDRVDLVPHEQEQEARAASEPDNEASARPLQSDAWVEQWR